MAIIKGTAGNDDLDATASGDWLYGMEGDDILSAYLLDLVVLNGNADDDLLIADSGEGVTLNGGAGNDILLVSFAKGGTLSGGAGDDRLDPADSTDLVLLGGDGDDYMEFAFVYNSTAKGGSGNDVFLLKIGGGGNVIDGGAGDDRFDLHAGGNTINGGKGDDVFEFHRHGGASTVSGGDGHDVFRFHSENYGTVIEDFHLKGRSEDVLDLQPLFEEAGVGGQELDWLIANGYLRMDSSTDVGGDTKNDTIVQADPDGFAGSEEWATIATLLDVNLGTSGANADNWLV